MDTPSSLAELARRLDNVIRLGTIAAVDHGHALCRVNTGGLLTTWLPWATRRAGDTRTWCPPTVGEQVLVISPCGEPGAGIVMTGVFSQAHDQPSAIPDKHLTLYPDGTRVEYDHARHCLLLSCVGDVDVLAAGHVRITAEGPVTVHTASYADVFAQGDARVAAGGDAEVRAAGFMQVIASGKLLVKSLTALILKGPSRTLRL